MTGSRTRLLPPTGLLGASANEPGPEELLAVLEATGAAVATTSSHGVLRTVTAAFARQFGADRHALTGASWRALYPESAHQAVEDALAGALDAPWRGTLAGRTADGRAVVHDLELRRLASDLLLWRVAEPVRAAGAEGALFERNPWPMWIYELDTLRIVDVNEAAVARYGYGRDEFLRLTIAELRPPEDRARLEQRVADARAGRGLSAVVRHRLRDGRLIDVEVTGHPFGTGPRPTRLVVAIDVTERLAAERARREADERFRSVVEQSLTGVYVIQDGRFTYVNPTFAEVFGYSIDEILALPSFEHLVAPEWVDVVAGHVRRRFAGAQADSHYLFHGVRKDGSHVVVEVHSSMARFGGRPATIGTLLDITARRQTEAEFRAIFEEAGTGVAVVALDGRLLRTNRSLQRMLGYSADELAERTVGDISHPDDRAVSAETGRPQIEELLAGQRTTFTTDRRYFRKDGSVMWGRLTSSLVRGPDGTPRFLIGMVEDATERRRVEAALHEREAELRRAQKMEAIGRLAGGIAHDFNNILAVVSSYSQFLQQALAPDDQRRDDVAEIRKAIDHAAALTRQLLAFGRRQVLQPLALDLNGAVLELTRLLVRVLGADVELRTALAPDADAVLADPGQLEQVLLNLAVNARDAMPAGGVLTIETANVAFDAADPSRPAGLGAGRWVRLRVSDTGTGMDEATRQRVFEPFFTTKAQGQGTGLGLSTVYGIVTQSGGWITVESAPDAGSTFTVYLPRSEAPGGRTAKADEDARATASRGGETVLVVDDEPAIRLAMTRVLRQAGYAVLAAADGVEALEQAAAHAGPVHVLVSDLGMPRMGGRELARRLRALRPETRVLFVSGNPDAPAPADDAGVPVLPKPFTLEQLLERVRELVVASG